MPRLLHPLLLLIARASEEELVRMVEFLKAENRMPRDRLPKRIELTTAERAKLLKLGARLGAALKEVITFVHPRTFSCWLGERHSRHILQSWLAYYHTARPHQGLGNQPIQVDSPLPEPIDGCRLDAIVCHEMLNGLLKQYRRKAA